MAFSKPTMAIAAVAAATPAVAFQSTGMQAATPEAQNPRRTQTYSELMAAESAATSGVSAQVAVSGAATLVAGAMLMANSRRLSKPAAKTVVQAFESERGVQDPVGFFDPLGFTADGSVENFKRRRQTEIKHGRVAMLATMGYITPEITGKLPGYLSPSTGVKYDDIPNGLGAISKVPAAGWGQMIAYAAFCELSQDQSAGTPAAEGDFGFKVLTSSDPAELEKKLSAEIANGRLAMMAIIGMFFQDGLTGSAWGDWASYTASPLRAFESERGVQDPVGFFDPLGFTADGSVENFKRRRQTEIKHGRVAMLATMGYITPEITGKLPGYLSPSTGVKYDDIPNGLGAISKVPAAGWGQMIAYAAFCELSQDQSAGTPAAEGDFGFKVLTSSDPAELEKKLSAEIANGRLAMMAIIGMFFQDGLTGSAWGDWASYTASPLRAFESELGVQPPVGFWDPLGFTKDGDRAAFQRRRATEFKHGRIAMLATMGYITPEIAGKFPGELSSELKFTDVPTGLAALGVVPFAGWLQIILYCYAVEAASGFGADSKKGGEPGNVGWQPPLFSGGWVGKDPTLRKKKLSVDLANGRLAMMAIIGMFFQDGLTGSPWGDWANYTDSPLRAFESERGVQDPVGFFDPLGFTADGSVENFKRRRQTEIKHGRVAMLATMGYITPEITGKLPGYLSPSTGVKYDDIPNGLGAISKVPAAGWGQMIAYAAFCELSQDQSAGTPAAEGDFGFKVLTSSDPAELEKKLSAEIANGRLAMMAIIGMFFQDGLTGSAWGDWASYTASPLRAFESERGVQDPVGFFDPLGFTADGSVENFKRRRQTEIKHGRVAMLATMGYITPEITGKLPGYLSPSTGVKYDDIPNGLGAISKVPAAGWGQMIAYAAFCELSQDQSAGTPAAEGDFGFKVLTSSDPAELEKKLSAEIANGRLAMMAIIGMFFQDGLTGSAWGDWASYTASPLRAFESERGVQDPVGFFDPLGFTADGSVENFKRRRQTEIKHGRVAMLATMGYITPEITGKLPGYLSPSTGVKYDDIPNGLGAISKVPAAGWGQMIAYAAFCELSQDQSAGTPAAEGDFGFKVLTSSDPAELEKKLSAEIANGRLAMMAIIGMFFQDGLTGSAWGDWASYTASPLRAFESERGVQDPVGFFDPLGFTADGSVENFKRRRQTEIKHGRVAMLATMGYITPEITGKLPGYLSPSTGVKYDDIPNGLGAISKVPAAGWGQMIAYAAFCELSQDQSAGTPAAEGDFGFKVLTSSDPAELEKKLSAEIANGRLAMMAIIGMFFQDGLTGSAWGDWASYTASPLRAFESERGVQDPVGFFDPLGFTADGSVENFKRRRQTEIKHGRVAMLATMGYITPEITGKLPGYLSPSTGVKYDDIPNGLGAISKVPAAGWGQMIAYAAFCELSQDQSAGTPAAEGDFGFKVLTSSDPAELEKKLSAEIANGRLAMMAIIGMFFQDGLTGSAWGDWASYTASPLR
ncbi:Light-harvesting complex [Amphidinium carterae]